MSSTSQKNRRKLSWIEIWEVLKETFTGFFAVQGIHHGAALAYYALFALIPLVYLSVSVFGRIIGKDTMVNIITNLMKNQIGINDVSGIISVVDMLNLDKGNFVMDVVGIFTLLVACSALMVMMKTSMNKYLGIVPLEVSVKRAFLEDLLFRLISIVMIAGFTLVIIVIYFAQLFAVSLGDSWFGGVEVVHWLLSSLSRHGLSILSNLMIFTFIFRYVHDGIVKWRLALYGAVVTSVILYLSQLGIKYYLVNFFFAANGGIAGSLLIIMVWVFYSSLIIFFGAKFTAVYAAKIGERILAN
jgi:membrane protein